jgi:hypothetical protein
VSLSLYVYIYIDTYISLEGTDGGTCTGLNLQDNHEELMELIGLRRHLGESEVERVAKARQLAVLGGGGGDISKVLVDLGMPPILRIPQDLGTVGDVLEAAVTVLERP